jgi:hypothetical protein
MLGWLARNHRRVVRNSRWIIMACGFALLALDGLPRDPADHAIAMIGVGVVAAVFALWVAVVAVSVIRPRTFAQWHHRRHDPS